MKWFVIALAALLMSGCYTQNEAIMEAGRPVELHLAGHMQRIEVAVPEIDGCEYAYLYQVAKGEFKQMFHWPRCRNCEKRSWPDGVEPMTSVSIRGGTTLYIFPFEIGDCDYFTIHTTSSGPAWSMVHRGHCKACSKRQRLQL